MKKNTEKQLTDAQGKKKKKRGRKKKEVDPKTIWKKRKLAAIE